MANDPKIYPLWLWKRLRFIVYDMGCIPAEYKEPFIEIVGLKAAKGKLDRHYKPQKLPVAVIANHNCNMDNYSTIFNKPDGELRDILETIFKSMANKWFGI